MTTTDSPTNHLDWSKVELGLIAAREQLGKASSEEQFQSIGLLCREILISIGQIVFNPSVHKTNDGVQPSETDAKRRLEAFLAIEFPGEQFEVSRRYVNSSISLANELQHKRTANYRDASLCMEATSSIATIFRILTSQSTRFMYPDLSAIFSFKTIARTQEEHIYELEVEIVNQGNNAINNYKFELLFPDLDTVSRRWSVLFSQNKSTDHFIMLDPKDQSVSIIHEPQFIRIIYRSKDILYSKDKEVIGEKIGLRYLINQDIYTNISEYQKIHWYVYADNYQPKEGTFSINKIINF